jgi:hypothetical protein
MLKKYSKVIIVLFLFPFFLLLTKNSFAEKCKDSDPECHSLRPYPGNPIDSEIKNTASLCGNSIVITDKIEVLPSQASSCAIERGGQSQTCSFSMNRFAEVFLKLDKSELPIMGNTEDVVNANTPADDISDIDKVNQYVSWYLNGVPYKAEYAYPSYKNEKDIYNIVNLSGPIKKLLPLEVQNNERVEEVKSVNKDRQNQTVACTMFGQPVPCYDKSLIQVLASILGVKKKNIYLSSWSDSSKQPPKLSSGNYKNQEFIDYWKDYKEWRGNTCFKVTIPVVNWDFLLCGDDPFKVNYWANLFPYIPMSSTEDRKGLSEIPGFSPSVSDDIKITDTEFKTTSEDLYFAHMEETTELASILQSTYTPKGYQTEKIDDITPVDILSNCKILDIRTNNGDNLWAKKANAELNYTAKFSCKFNVNNPTACIKEPVIAFAVNTKTPLAEKAWDNFVAGSNSIFRRMFPKTGEGSPVISPLDMPGSTQVSYESNKALAQSTGEIYFNHLGGISEYFLKGIQTALRPKGYGEPIMSSSTTNVSGISGTCSVGSGPCSVSNLLSYFGGDTVKATKASIICNKESGSNPNAVNKGCLTGRSVDYSIGLFQINLLAHGNANNVNFDYTWSPVSCTIKNLSAVQQLEQRFLNPTENIKYAVTLSRNGTSWSAWSAAKACGIQ